MKKAKSDMYFEFKAQFGGRPGRITQADKELKKIIDTGRRAEKLLKLRILWDGKWQAWSYAWQAKEKTRDGV